MSRDQLIGAIMTICAIAGIAIYGWIIFFTPWDIILLKITGFIAIAGVLGIIGWIGYTLATTPPPKPIEEIEKELEKELKDAEAREEKTQSK